MFVNSENSKRDDNTKYSQVIFQIKEDGVCPFCPDQLSKYHTNPINYDGTYWVATDNLYPYKGAKHHLLLIHKAHIASVSEISNDAWIELHTIINSELTRLNISGGTFFMRFGDTRYTGASVTHLHCQLVSRDLASGSDEPILTRIG